MKKMQKERCLPCFRRWARTPYAVFNSLSVTVKIGVLGAAMLTTANQKAVAQENVKTAPDPVFQLEEVQINSDLPPTTQQLVKVVAVLTRKEIEQAAVQNVQGLLRYVQGVDLRTRGTENVQADISLRGGTFDQTAILLNGVNFTDPQTGHFNLDMPLDINLIERVEILYGPGAWTAGAIAFSGAINIVTKQIIHNGFNAQISGGDFGYRQGSTSGYLNTGPWRVTAAVNGTRSDGFAHDSDFKIFNAYTDVRFIDNRIGQFSLQLGMQSKDFGANTFYSPKYLDQYEETRSLIASLQYKKQTRHWKLMTSAYYRRHHDMFALFREGVPAPPWYVSPNYHLTDVMGISAQASYSWWGGVTSLAGDLRSEHIFSNTLGTPLNTPHFDPYSDARVFTKSAERRIGSVSVKQVKEWEQWIVSLGAMGSGNDDYGFHFYAGGNVDYAVTPKLTLGTWLHNSYRMPTFTDLYYQSTTQHGNPDLKPEDAFNVDVHLLWTPDRWTIRVAGFKRYGHNIIDWVRLPNELVWHSENLTDVNSLGSELAIDYRPVWRWIDNIHLDYTYLHVSKGSSQYISSYSTDYLRHQAKMRISQPLFGKLSAAWQLSLNDRAGTYVNVATNKETQFKAYLLCDLKLQWKEKHYRIFAEATNLFNTTYFDFGNLPQPGRWFKAGVSVGV
ncbi:TonB-dependent receptor [Paludibacter jiangxiensis]|uniref:Iron complex outermembrane recepter protein n=1 Tax=Paludibacter jiangxiensis TaxID=681398 RepID=A0A170Y267_9BACT|nr:TonB-dependent receptor [Paludibacter jiangxiensis]GAT61443.1 iron complex outermembrane recepter protein [Paludibacter jiangxiensis]